MDKLPKNFAFLVYQEDVTPDFVDDLSLYLSSFCENFAFVLHDNPDDLHRDDDTDKKPHYHVLCCLARSGRRASAFCRDLGLPSVTPARIKSVFDVSGYARYLTHDSKDCDNRVKYPSSSVVTNSREWYEDICNGCEVADPVVLLEDVALLITKSISLRQFIKLHPVYLYRMGELNSLIKMVYEYEYPLINKCKDDLRNECALACNEDISPHCDGER